SDSLWLEAFSFRKVIFLIGEIIQLSIIVGFSVISLRYYQHVKLLARHNCSAFFVHSNNNHGLEG
ncbi:MAG: hypothetical protein ACXWMV_13710, partial [Syntrophales bacterium]